MTAICEKLKTIREKTGMEESQIAEYLGVTQNFIAQVESGKRELAADQLENLVDLYGYSLSFPRLKH